MLVIRLMRTGKIHAPHYRLVVQEKRSKLNGKAVDTIGHYHPAQASKLLVIDKERAAYWLSKGAQCSDTVTNLMVREGILAKDRKVSNFFTPVAKEEVKVEAAAPAVVAEEVSEAPVEETAMTEETPAEADATPETEPTAEETAPEAAPVA
jgi:small subunit ribosomal protein S16